MEVEEEAEGAQELLLNLQDLQAEDLQVRNNGRPATERGLVREGQNARRDVIDNYFNQQVRNKYSMETCMSECSTVYI